MAYEEFTHNFLSLHLIPGTGDMKNREECSAVISNAFIHSGRFWFKQQLTVPRLQLGLLGLNVLQFHGQPHVASNLQFALEERLQRQSNPVQTLTCLFFQSFPSSSIFIPQPVST